MQDNATEDRPQASVKVCGHEIFNTEEHTLKAPSVAEVPLGNLEDFEFDVTTRDEKIIHP